MVDKNSLATERGARLKKARKLARLTLKEMGNDGHISPNTLAAWESAVHAGLTQKGAHKVVKRLQKEDIICTIGWLMHGTGDPPKKLHASPIVNLDLQTQPDKYSITNEIKLFEQLHPDFIGLVIEDECMNPCYKQGDFVAGKPLPLNKIKLTSGKTVIAKLYNGKPICRNLFIDEQTGSPYLVATNLHHAPEPILQNVVITELAIVLCHFTQDSLYN